MPRSRSAGMKNARTKSPKQNNAPDMESPRRSNPSQCRPACKPSEAKTLAPGLYVVATPIGNLEDITLRALDILRQVDWIACEDTRVSRVLLARYGITTRLATYFDHNAELAGPQLLQRLADNERIALISDAGTPLISDPGYRLVAACHERGIKVIPIPGPSSVLSLLSAAGLPTDRFLFLGFLPNRAAQRREVLSEVRPVRATLVIMESPRRLNQILPDILEILGDRPVTIGRELTKRFEEIRRATLSEMVTHVTSFVPPKGEVTLAIGPPEKILQADDTAVEEALTEAMKTQPPSRAAAQVARATGRSRHDIYALALALQKR